MQNCWRHCLVVVCLSAVAVPLGAQTTEEEELAMAYGDKSFVTIATGNRQPVSRAPSVATVITAEEIRAMGATDLDQVLETVPGLHVAVGSPSYNPIYVIRGIYHEQNPQILLLINGIPMKIVFTGGRSQLWGGMPVENIARIEVIRGPGSALYGADAYSGVINIITKNAAHLDATQVGARYGSFDTREGWVQHGGKWGSIDVAVFLQVGRTDGHRETVAADRQTGLDRLLGTNASVAPGPVNTQRDSEDFRLDLAWANWRWRGAYQDRRNVGSGTGVAQALDPRARQHGERYFTDLTYDNPELATDWGASAQLSYAHFAEEHDLVLFPPGASFGPGRTFPDGVIGNPHKYERQYRFGLATTYSGVRQHRFRLGAGAEYLSLYKIRETKNFTTVSPTNATPVPLPTGVTDVTDTAPFLTPHSRRVVYGYLQDEWSFAKDWYLTAGLRYDDYSDFGSTVNPRAALVWAVAYNVTAKLLFGRAFRAPSFSELHSTNNPATIGNPNLEPETVQTTEVAVAWQATGALQANFSVFRYERKDIIALAPDPSGTRTFQNTGKHTGSGFELEVTWDAARSLHLTGNYAYQRSIDEATDSDAGYAPHHHVYARADWRFLAGWTAGTQVNHVAERRRVAGDTRPSIPDYTTVDLLLRKEGGGRPGLGWEVAAGVRNLFDDDVREPSLAPGLIPNDLPQAGRSAYVQARLTF